jgi:biopolymer transport protein ExbD
MPKVQPIPSAPSGRSRRARGVRVSTSLAEINVVPLVDVMLVLLIIFMVAAPMLQRGVEVNIPVSAKSQEISSERIFVDVPMSFRKDHRVFLGKESIPIDVLAERLRQLMSTRSDKQAYLRIDAQLFVQDQINVMQEMKEAGILNVGIVTELPTK